MSVHPGDPDDADFDPSRADGQADERYTFAEMAGGEVLFYDREDNSAWIKSTVAISLDEVT